jgi:acyl-homoserine-lactone acylase
MTRRSLPVALLIACSASATAIGHAQTPASTDDDLSRRVVIRRTPFGVPHINATNIRAAGYGLAYVQMEDYGARVAFGLLRARGEMGRWFGRDSMRTDFAARRAYARAVEAYPGLEQETRDAYDGFAAGVNRYVSQHPEEFPPGFAPRFTGYDVAARDVNLYEGDDATRFLARFRPPQRSNAAAAQSTGESAESRVDPIEEGSNAWAFAPSRTRSGKAILMRNPHLAWNAGYYEAHFTVPGVVDYYGDFRIGGPFGVVGGFNRWLGWSTTNNAFDPDEIYALDVDTAATDRYLFEGASLPLLRDLVTVEYKNGPGFSTETREVWRTPIGPVIHRDSGKIYVLRGAGDNEFRRGEQYFRMMRAKSLAEWKDAMRMRAITASNYTYADRAGNIFYVWNATVPALPASSGGDTTAIPARRTADLWTRFVPFDSLPQLLNPRGGYVQNENDPPYYTNLQQVLDRNRYPANFPEPRLGLRTQHSLSLLDNRTKFSLEEIVRLKHSYRMLIADRLKDELLTAVRAASPSPEVAEAADLLARWDNTVAPTSKGGPLFDVFLQKYSEGQPQDSMYAVQWTPQAPMATPRGLKSPERAVAAFTWAVAETKRRYGAIDVAWGDVHRVRIGSVDVPVGGCPGWQGCFRVLQYRTDPDGKRSAVGGDGWILAVEFGNEPRGLSVLAYGESPKKDSPHSADQAEMFARGELKRILFTDAEIEANTIRRYSP